MDNYSPSTEDDDVVMEHGTAKNIALASLIGVGLLVLLCIWCFYAWRNSASTRGVATTTTTNADSEEQEKDEELAAQVRQQRIESLFEKCGNQKVSYSQDQNFIIERGHVFITNRIANTRRF